MAKKKAKAEPVIYVGPQIRGRDLRTYRVYPGGIPDAYADDAAFRHLFVPLEKFADARAQLRKKGTALSVFYAEAAHSTKKEG